MKYSIEIDVAEPPVGYGPPEWGVWEKGVYVVGWFLQDLEEQQV